MQLSGFKKIKKFFGSFINNKEATGLGKEKLQDPFFPNQSISPLKSTDRLENYLREGKNGQMNPYVLSPSRDYALNSELLLEGSLFRINVLREELQDFKEKLFQSNKQIVEQSRFADKLLNSAPDGIIGVTENHEITIFNKQAELIFGYHSFEIIGQPFTNLVPEYAWEKYNKKLKYYTEHRGSKYFASESASFELMGLKESGAEFPAQVSFSRVNMSENKVVLIGIRDITEQKKSQKVLSALVDVQNTFIGETTAKESFKKILDFLLNVTQSEYGLIGEVTNIKDYGNCLSIHALSDNFKINKDGTSKLSEHFGEDLFQNIMKNGKPLIGNIARGEEGFTSYLGIPFHSNNELIGVVGVSSKTRKYSMHDVELLAPLLVTCSTLIKSYQNSLRTVEAEKKVHRLAEIVSHSSDAIISADIRGKVLSWNLGAEKMLGYSASEMIGTSIDRLGLKQLKKDHSDLIRKTYAGTAVESYETLQLKKEGAPIHVNMSIFPLKDEDGNVKGISSILRDISEQKEAQQIKEGFTKRLEKKVRERTEELEKARIKLAISLEKEKELSELKSHFVSMVSHQFRTPLTVIQANMGILEMQADQMPDKLKNQFETISEEVHSQVSKMTELMNDVLILGKLNGGSLSTNFAMTDITAICQDLVDKYNAIQTDGRTIDYAIIGKKRDLKLDGKLLSHALSNLICNAFKYSKNRPNPRLIVNFEKPGVGITVADQGIGVPDNEIEHIFEPFNRGSNAIDLPGTGLGMVIAREFVELNKGTINVKSKFGEGSEFTILI